MAAVNAPSPPFLLLLDALERFRALRQVEREELAHWETVTI